jgi:hypothetical protein
MYHSIQERISDYDKEVLEKLAAMERGNAEDNKRRR